MAIGLVGELGIGSWEPAVRVSDRGSDRRAAPERRAHQRPRVAPRHPHADGPPPHRGGGRAAQHVPRRRRVGGQTRPRHDLGDAGAHVRGRDRARKHPRAHSRYPSACQWDTHGTRRIVSSRDRLFGGESRAASVGARDPARFDPCYLWEGDWSAVAGGPRCVLPRVRLDAHCARRRSGAGSANLERASALCFGDARERRASGHP